MDIKQATPNQIASFKVGAAARFQELGVPADVANELFAFEMAKVASELGVVPSANPVNVQKVANDIAATLGRTRKPAAK